MSAPDMRVFSCGLGVQSTTISLLIRDGELAAPDHVVFADTGWEPPHVYRQLERLEALFAELSVPFHRVSQGNLREDAVSPDHRFASIPYFVRNPDGSEGMGRRQCTAEYKLAPINRKIRELAGAKAPDFKRVPKGTLVEQWVGFSTDEIGRVSIPRQQYLTARYPLLDLDMSRADCAVYLERAGWGDTAKSACIGCPYHGNRQWREMRDNHPDQWADAVAFDEAIRKGGARGLPLNGEAFLHRSRVPLPLAPIDHVTKAEARALAEGGDRGACSPYGCDSGERIDPFDALIADLLAAATPAELEALRTSPAWAPEHDAVARLCAAELPEGTPR